jgi:uncharacterized protein YndB with AHSA1/START domain
MTAWFEMRPVGLGFLVDGPMRFEVAVQTSLSREQCWGAFTDAAGWSSWFPGVREAGYRKQALPYGVGTIRTAEVSGVRFEETILAWDEPARWIYRIDRCTAELATAQVEATVFEERPGGGTRVVWSLASDPCPPMAAAADALPGILEQKLTEAMRNLERHRRGVASPAVEEGSP